MPVLCMVCRGTGRTQEEGQDRPGCAPTNIRLYSAWQCTLHRTAQYGGDLWRQLCSSLGLTHNDDDDGGDGHGGGGGGGSGYAADG